MIEPLLHHWLGAACMAFAAAEFCHWQGRVPLPKLSDHLILLAFCLCWPLSVIILLVRALEMRRDR